MLIDKIKEQIRVSFFPNGKVKTEILNGNNYIHYYGNGEIKLQMINGVYEEFNSKGELTWPKK